MGRVQRPSTNDGQGPSGSLVTDYGSRPPAGFPTLDSLSSGTGAMGGGFAVGRNSGTVHPGRKAPRLGHHLKPGAAVVHSLTHTPAFPPHSLSLTHTRVVAASPFLPVGEGAICTCTFGIGDRRPPKSVEIKICGVRDVDTALHAAHKGASFIGLVFVPGSKRFIGDNISEAIAIVKAMEKKTRCEVWGVFKDEGVEEMEKIINSTGIKGVQFHGVGSKRSLLQYLNSSTDRTGRLIENVKWIWVSSVAANGEISMESQILDMSLRQTLIDIERSQDKGTSIMKPDFILFDGVQPGNGEPFDWASLGGPQAGLQRSSMLPWSKYPIILAGGMNDENVLQAMKCNHPDIVDLSNGVEDPRGSGDKELYIITKFCHTVLKTNNQNQME